MPERVLTVPTGRTHFSIRQLPSSRGGVLVVAVALSPRRPCPRVCSLPRCLALVVVFWIFLLYFIVVLASVFTGMKQRDGRYRSLKYVLIMSYFRP